MKKNPANTKGKLRQNTKTLCGQPNAALSRIAIPPAPPTVNSLGAIRAYAAKAIRKEETSIKNVVLVQDKSFSFSIMIYYPQYSSFVGAC